MLLDIFRCLPARRITGHRVVIVVRVLVDPDVVETHVSGHQFVDGLIDRCKALSHAQIHDDRHRFDWDHALADITVRPHSPGIQSPRLVFTDEPSHRPLRAWFVLKRVDLVRLAIVPVVV